jgi:hypothetical protein
MKWIDPGSTTKTTLPQSRAAAKREEDKKYEYKKQDKWGHLPYAHCYCMGGHTIKKKERNDGFGVVSMWELSHYKKGIIGFFYKKKNAQRAAK